MLPNSKEFLKLQKKWYEKLKKSGFEDAETGPYLKQYSSRLFETNQHKMINNNNTELYYATKEQYYRIAGHFLHEHVFQDPIHKTIWQEHSEGLSVREIGKLHRLGPNVIQRIVKHYATIMLSQNKEQV